MASAEPAEGSVEANVKKAVDFLWQEHNKKHILQPKFVDFLRETYKDTPGWEFLRGPSESGWDYFVERIAPLQAAVEETALLYRWPAEAAFAHKFMNKSKQATIEKWTSAADARSAAGHPLTSEADSARMLKLSNFGLPVRQRLFKQLAKVGTVEYCEFTHDAAANHSCVVQFKHVSEADKVVQTIESAKKRTFSYDRDLDGMLRAPSPILQLVSSAVAKDRKLSGFDILELADVFSLFSSAAPSLMHEKSQFSDEYTVVVITFDHAADAEAALENLQKTVAEDFGMELQYMTEDAKAETVAQWINDGSSVGGVYHGGVPARVSDLGDVDMHVGSSSNFLEALQSYRVMGDDTLERVHDLPTYQARLSHLQSNGAKSKAEYATHIAMKQKGFQSSISWSEEPELEFSLLRLRSKIEVLAPTGQVEAIVKSPDYEAGSYLHLNPGEEMPKPAIDDDSDDDMLAIDAEEAFEATKEEPAGMELDRSQPAVETMEPETVPEPPRAVAAPILSREEFERVKRQKMAEAMRIATPPAPPLPVPVPEPYRAPTPPPVEPVPPLVPDTAEPAPNTAEAALLAQLQAHEPAALLKALEMMRATGIAIPPIVQELAAAAEAKLAAAAERPSDLQNNPAPAPPTGAPSEPGPQPAHNGHTDDQLKETTPDPESIQQHVAFPPQFHLPPPPPPAIPDLPGMPVFPFPIPPVPPGMDPLAMPPFPPFIPPIPPNATPGEPDSTGSLPPPEVEDTVEIPDPSKSQSKEPARKEPKDKTKAGRGFRPLNGSGGGGDEKREKREKKDAGREKERRDDKKEKKQATVGRGFRADDAAGPARKRGRSASADAADRREKRHKKEKRYSDSDDDRSRDRDRRKDRKERKRRHSRSRSGDRKEKKDRRR
ncbi:hypothetical protein DIPPA_29132 [Diplonema papillatum]|nr:hypothetical protein DIPPA_29132 [Diplonema papillatum]